MADRMLVILRGDDTAANGRGIRMRLPDVDVGDGFEILFTLCGVERSGAYEPGGTLVFNYSREETAAFPLGVSYAVARLEKEGLMQTISNTIPVKVTDSVAEAAMAASGGEGSGGGNSIGLSVVVNTGVPKIDRAALTKGSSVADIKALANAILDAINGSAE